MQARRKQLHMGGGGAHITDWGGGGGGTHIFFFFFLIFFFFFFWGGGHICANYWGGGTAPRAPYSYGPEVTLVHETNHSKCVVSCIILPRARGKMIQYTGQNDKISLFSSQIHIFKT